MKPAGAGAAAAFASRPGAALAGGPPRPRRVVLFHIDALRHRAPERLGLTRVRRLARVGTRVREALIVAPWHPTVSGFWELSTTSPPNPTTLAGSLFLRPWTEQPHLRHRFPGFTAHIANSTAYRSLNPGFTHTRLDRGATDEDNVRLALRLVRDHDDLSFTRLVLQDANAVSQRVADAADGEPWARDIYGPGSPYPAVVREADRLLGEFLNGLERLGELHDTLVVLLSDGQARTGWHPVQQEDSRRVPLVFAGPGVAAGRTVPYAESTDIAPTVAPEVPRRPARLNRQIVTHPRLQAWLRLHAGDHPLLDTALIRAESSYFTESQFWGLDRVDEWPAAGSVDTMLRDNDYALRYLHDALAASGAPAFPERWGLGCAGQGGGGGVVRGGGAAVAGGGGGRVRGGCRSGPRSRTPAVFRAVPTRVPPRPVPAAGADRMHHNRLVVFVGFPQKGGVRFLGNSGDLGGRFAPSSRARRRTSSLSGNPRVIHV
ncbi:hypothetical protein GCM10027168_28160 [Streptomyces capparidis]